MGLSCDCNFDNWGDERTFYYVPHDFTKLATKRRRRCCSCKELIGIGDPCLNFYRFHNPLYDIEENIYGDDGEVPMASWYMCESCGEIFLNLNDLGFCVDLGVDDMCECLREYQKEYSHPSWRKKYLSA